MVLHFNVIVNSNIEELVDVACSGFDNATFTINQDSTTAECEMNENNISGLSSFVSTCKFFKFEV